MDLDQEFTPLDSRLWRFIAAMDNTVILEINAWLKKMQWNKFTVFELKCYVINANWVMECKLKTTTKIITDQLSERVCSLKQENPQVHSAGALVFIYA